LYGDEEPTRPGIPCREAAKILNLSEIADHLIKPSPAACERTAGLVTGSTSCGCRTVDRTI